MSNFEREGPNARNNTARKATRSESPAGDKVDQGIGGDSDEYVHADEAATAAHTLQMLQRDGFAPVAMHDEHRQETQRQRRQVQVNKRTNPRIEDKLFQEAQAKS